MDIFNYANIFPTFSIATYAWLMPLMLGYALMHCQKIGNPFLGKKNAINNNLYQTSNNLQLSFEHIELRKYWFLIFHCNNRKGVSSAK